MFRYLLLLTLVLFSSTPTLAAGRKLKVPEGFEIKEIIAPPQIGFPVSGCYDNKGRLYVTEMSGPITREEVGQQKPLHHILRLEDKNGDGVFETVTMFADGLPFPEGILWHEGAIYAACPPKIWKFVDTNDDGNADKREVWYDGKTLTGCANDLHGPYLGPDGYIYWAKGAFAKQDHVLANGKTLSSRASHIFRAKPDGSNLDVVMTGGMDNPVDVVFTPRGDRIFTTTFFQFPADGKRDGLIHAIYGGIYGKDHDVIHDAVHKWTSPQLMPVMSHMGPAAPCGLHVYNSTQFGPEYAHNLFACQFNLRTISRHVLTPKGSTYESKDIPFVTSDDMDFHPTDVFEDADGDLIIIDTGGWYKLCCPSSQLVKADVYGGIYRVSKKGAKKATRLPTQPLPELYWVSLNRDKKGLDQAIAGLQSPDLPTRRLAAEACGRIGDAKAVPAILAALRLEDNDHAIDHSLTYALIEIADAKATAAGLTDASPRVRRAAVAALQAIAPTALDGKLVAMKFTTDPSRELRETAWWVAAQHAEWGDHLVGLFRQQLQSKQSDSERAELVTRLASFGKNDLIQKMLADMAGQESAGQLDALKAMARSGLKETPTLWWESLATLISGKNPLLIEEAARTARALSAAKPVPVMLKALEAVAANTALSDNLRLQALAAIKPGLVSPNETTIAFLIAHVRGDRPADDRNLAAEVLSRATLDVKQLVELSKALKGASPVERTRLLEAFTRSKDNTVGVALATALSEPSVRTSMRTDMVKPIFDKFSAKVQAEAAKLYIELEKARSGERDRLEAIFKELPTGDVRRGQIVFNSQKAACITCHKIGYVGGQLGPDLTRIGGIRTEKDLLDSILYPSAAIVRGYEPVKVNTKDGVTHMGILKKDAPDEVIVALAADKEVRVARADVESIQPGTVSVMPVGLEQQISRQDLADLIAFLRASR